MNSTLYYSCLPYKYYKCHTRVVSLTLCTQSFLCESSIHLSRASWVSTRMKLLDCAILVNNPSSNLPAFSLSISKNTEYPRSCRWTLRRLKREKQSNVNLESVGNCITGRLTYTFKPYLWIKVAYENAHVCLEMQKWHSRELY